MFLPMQCRNTIWGFEKVDAAGLTTEIFIDKSDVLIREKGW
jgi:hypothetical protein